MAICLGWRLSFAFYKMLVSSASYKMKSFKLFLTAITRGKIKRPLCRWSRISRDSAKIYPCLKNRSTRSMTFFSRPGSEKWLEEHFLKGYEETDFDQVEGDLMESIQQALYEAESFFAFHLSNEGQVFGKAKYLEAVQEVLDQIGSLTGRTNKEQLTSVLKASWRLVGLQMGGAFDQ